MHAAGDMVLEVEAHPLVISQSQAKLWTLLLCRSRGRRRRGQRVFDQWLFWAVWPPFGHHLNPAVALQVRFIQRHATMLVLLRIHLSERRVSG